MLNCSASLRSAALAYSGDPRTAEPLAGLNVRNLAATSSPFNASLGASPELTGNAGLDEMPRLVSVHGADADYGDVTAGAGDTITLTFDIATDRGGRQVGGPLF